jgi:hypothetical protein
MGQSGSKSTKKEQEQIDDFIKNIQIYLNKMKINPDNKTYKEIVLEAVKQNGDALECASDELKNNFEIVLEAVKQNGYALEYASDELKNDFKIVLAAVKQHEYALIYASDELKNNFEIVLAAVKRNGYALEYASDELKNNFEIVLEAVTQDGRALEYVSDELKNSESFKTLLNLYKKLDDLSKNKSQTIEEKTAELKKHIANIPIITKDYTEAHEFLEHIKRNSKFILDKFSINGIFPDYSEIKKDMLKEKNMTVDMGKFVTDLFKEKKETGLNFNFKL